MAAVLYVGNRNYSSWSMRGSLLVRQSGIECEEVVIPLDTHEGRAKLAQVSPTRRVPVLHYDDIVVWDSLAIAEFLNERKPNAGLWPADPDARAFARCVSAEMHACFGALRAEMPMDVRGKHRVAISRAVREDVERIQIIWTTCRKLHGGAGVFLFGAWCAADAMFAPVVTRFRTYGVPLVDEAQRYADAVLAWPAVASLVSEAAAEPWTLDLGI